MIKNVFKRALSFGLAIVLAGTGLPARAWAAESAPTAVSAASMEAGKTYMVPLTRYDADGNKVDRETSTPKIGVDNIAPYALVTPDGSGQYDVTFSWAGYQSIDIIQFYKQGIIKDSASFKDVKMGTYNIPEKFIINDEDLPDSDKISYSSEIMREFLDSISDEKENSNYIQDVTMTDSGEYHICYVSLKLDDLNERLYFKGFGTIFFRRQNIDVTLPENHDKFYENCQRCYFEESFAFDPSAAEEVVDLSKYTTDNTSFHLSRTQNTWEEPVSSDTYTEYVSTFFEPDVNITQNADGTISAVFALKAANDGRTVKKIMELGDMWKQNDTTLNAIRTYHKNCAQQFPTANWDELNNLLENNTFTVTYASSEEAAWGKLINFTASDNTPYQFIIGISAVDNTVTFTSDNMSFTTTKDNIDESGVFSSNPLTADAQSDADRQEYENLSALFVGHCSDYLIYRPTFYVGSRKRNPKAPVDIRMTLPEGWDADKLMVYYIQGSGKEASLNEIDLGVDWSPHYSIDGSTCTLTTAEINKTYVLAQKAEPVSGDVVSSLEDGVYSVEVVSWNKDQPDQLSMSNVAIDKDSTLLTVKDGVYTLYMSLQDIYISGRAGHASRLFYTDNDGNRQEFTYYSWVTTEDGSSVYNTDYYGQTYGLYYPVSVSGQLSAEAVASGVYEVEFFVPVMDEISGYEPGSGKGSRTAQLKFYNLQKLSDDAALPTYEPSWLLKSIEDAEGYTKAEDTVRAMYDETLMGELTTMTENARRVYEQMLTVANGETISNAAAELSAAIPAFVRGSLNAQIEKARGLSSEDYSEASYALMTSALENAVAVLNSDASSVADMDDALAKLYTAVEGLVGVNTVDRTGLKEKLDAAAAELARTEIYTPSSLKVFQELVDGAQSVYDDENAGQDAVDEQTAILENGMKALVRQADKTALREKYEEALKVYEEGNDSGRYDAEAWDAFAGAVEAARALLEDGDASASEVAAARTALFNTMNDLTVSVDKSALNALIAQVRAEDVSGCTEASVSVLQAALTSAEAAAGSADASQDTINKQYTLLSKAYAALVLKADGNVVFDGTYTIFGRLWQVGQDIPENWQDETAEGASMGDKALNHTIQMTVKDGRPTLNLEFIQNRYSLFGEEQTGYLKNLRYYPGYTDILPPTGLTPTDVTVTAYWEDDAGNRISDDYGTDYPRYMDLPLESLGQNLIWVQVYVPVMEAIQSGTGTQPAKLILDWDSRIQISGNDTDKTGLNALIAEAKDTVQGDASQEAWDALQAAIASAEAVSADMNTSDDVVAATMEMLRAAMQAMTTETVETDKKELEELLEKAEAYLNDKTVVYTEATLRVLETAYEQAGAVNNDAAASQEAVNAAVMNLKNAIGGLEIAADKTGLKEAMDAAEICLKDTESYTAAAIDALRILYGQAEAAYNDTDTAQSDVDALASALRYMVESMKKLETEAVDKSGLAKMLMTASNMAGRTSVYTEESVNALLEAIRTAQSVYDDDTAAESDVKAQMTALTDAVLALKVRPADSSNGIGNNDDNNNGGNDNNNNGGSNNNNGSLDIRNLEDGVYAITGNMVKIDKVSASMSDAAINHTIKLTVENGVYHLTMNFKGLTIGQQLGYLSQLRYFTTGYTLNQYGAPQGDLADVTVEAYQKNSDGSLVSDTYGTDYPESVTFELIPEALNDGYVPLQVFVPVMEGIADGTGTQPVFLKLDWSTLTKTTADDPNFNGNGSNDNNNNNNNNGSGSNGSGSLSGGSSLGGGSSLSGGSSLNGGSSLSGSSSLKSGTSSLSGSSSLKSGTSSVKTGDETPVNAWAALCAISALAMAVALIQRKKSRMR